MKRTLTRLAEHIADAAAEIGVQAQAMPDDCGIAGAECVIHLRDAQRSIQAAADALKLAIAQRADRPAELQGKPGVSRQGKRPLRRFQELGQGSRRARD